MKKEGVHFNIPSVESLIPKEAIHKDEEQRRKEMEERHIAAEKIKEEENQNRKEGRATQNTSQDEEASTNVEDQEIEYRVQFYSSPTKVSETDPDFKGLEDISIYKESNIWKYTSGKFKDFKTANKYKNSIKEKYKDAFVVIFYKNERITLEKAKKIERQIKK